MAFYTAPVGGLEGFIVIIRFLVHLVQINNIFVLILETKDNGRVCWLALSHLELLRNLSVVSIHRCQRKRLGIGSLRPKNL